MGRCVPDLLAAALRHARTRLTSPGNPGNAEGGAPRHGRSRCAPGHTGPTPISTSRTETDMKIKNRHQHKQ
jgi:hypothetical protein